ncbi:hypothetical protein ABT234_11685 [Streptomyces sp. NPDC001586]|uniref:hypothetical protein n=1 Tax=Streptomyces sp. NPDC001586 TaxID=3154387 RepID=UPI0033343D36
MAAGSTTATIGCPACSEQLTVQATARYGSGQAYLEFDFGQIYSHVEQHRVVEGGERDGQAP